MDKVHNAEHHIDLILSKSKKENLKYKIKSKITSRTEKIQRLERNKIISIYSNTVRILRRLQDKYARINELDNIYLKLLEFDNVDFDDLNKRLHLLGTISRTIKKQLDKIKDKIRFSKSKDFFVIKKSAIGYLTNRINRLNKTFSILDDVRKKIKSLPSFKEGYKTVAIAGFPNVGKSTLLMKITGASPEIQSYSFTTKKLNLGYYNKMQYIDTPGTLNRTNMNSIEKKADLIIKKYCDEIILVIDATLAKPIDNYIKLLKDIIKTGKPIKIYISMTDIVNKKDIDKIKETLKYLKLKIFSESEELK